MTVTWCSASREVRFNIICRKNSNDPRTTAVRAVDISVFCPCKVPEWRSQWPRGLKRRSAVARLLGLRVRIPPGAWMSVCWECCVLSGRYLCDELITRPEESYWLWCVVVRDLETSRMRSWPALGRSAKRKPVPEYVTRMKRIERYKWVSRGME